MKQKIKFIVFLAFWGVFAIAQAQPYVEIEIIPSMEKSGNIIVNITNLKQTNYNRLILLTLPMELTPCLPVPNGTSQKFNGCWYIDRDNNKSQLWIGNILQAGKTDLQMQMRLPNMMRKSDNVSHSYKLHIRTNYNDGLHKFLSLTHNDSTEIVFANKIVFKGNKEYPVLEAEPEIEWRKRDENERIYILPSQNQEANTFLIFGVPNVADTINFMLKVIPPLLCNLLFGVGLYKLPKAALKKVCVISGFFVVIIASISCCLLLSKDSEFDVKDVFKSIMLIVGYVCGVFIAFGVNKKEKNEKSKGIIK